MATDMYRFSVSLDDETRQALDDFRFENRFIHQSTATLYLIQLGLQVDKVLSTAKDEKEFVRQMKAIYEKDIPAQEDIDDTEKPYTAYARIGVALDLSEKEYESWMKGFAGESVRAKADYCDMPDDIAAQFLDQGFLIENESYIIENLEGLLITKEGKQVNHKSNERVR